MDHRPPERDWKVFREVRKLALERLCDRVLEEATAVIEDTSKTSHERFLGLFDVLGERNQEVARGFDDPKRSTMIFQLAFIQLLGLLEPEELARFSESTRDTLETLAQLR